MENKNNKGFTLIELLVAVAIMLSILGVAIVSFVSISDRKKEEAWETVKSQIETAAEQYFKSNEYLFEGLGNVTATISVGKLVADDYLNVVTDPRTGRKISYCSLVNITKHNGVFTVTATDDISDDDKDNNADNKVNEEDCVTGNTMTISEVGGPAISHVSKCGAQTTGNDWCRKRKDGETDLGFDGVKITVTSDDAAYVNVTKNGNEVKCKSDGTEGCILDDGKYIYTDDSTTSSSGQTVKFTAVGTNGAKTYKEVTYYVDLVGPKELKLEINSTEKKYESNNVNLTMSASDVGSGIDSYSYSDGKNKLSDKNINSLSWSSGANVSIVKELTKSAQTATGKLTVIDKADNKEEKTTSYSLYQLCSVKKENGTAKTEEVCDTGTGFYKWTETNKYLDQYVSSISCDDEPEIKTGSVCKKDCPKLIATGGTCSSRGNTYNCSGSNLILTHDDPSDDYWWWTGLNSANFYEKSISITSSGNYKLSDPYYRNFCEYTVNYDTTLPTCSISLSGPTKNYSGWYTGDVTLTLTTDADEYDLSTSTTAKYTGRKTRTQTEDTTGQTYYGYVKDKYGNTNVCSATVKKDTVAPSWELTSTTFTHINVDDPAHSRKVVFQGDFNVTKSNGTYTGTICMNNITNGAVNINNNKGKITSTPLTFYYPSLSFTDSTSGVDESTVIYSDKFTLKDGSLGDFCPRTNSACKWNFYISVSDKAGNTLSNANFLSLDTGYILNKSNGVESDNFYSPCYYHSISNRYISGTLTYDESRIINTYCKNGSCQTIK